MTSSPENKITRSDLVKSAVNVGALGMEFSWTYYKQMNIAFCLMVANMLKKIYVSVNIFFTIFTNVFSPIAPTRMRRIRQRGCAAFGV